MSRSGYTEDYGDDEGQWALIRWRGQVVSSIRGKRGQAFLREMLEALDAMPNKRLIANDLQANAPAFIPPEVAQPCVCAIGSVGIKRGVDLKALDPDDYWRLSGIFGIARPLVQEIEYENDEGGRWNETPEQRWQRMRAWAVEQLKEPVA